MAGMYTAEQRAKGIDLQDMGTIVFHARSTDVPFMALLSRGGKGKAKKPRNRLVEWPVKLLQERGFGPTREGVDKTTFDHTTRDKLRAYGMKLESPGWLVTDWAELLETAGVPDEVADQRADDLILHAEMQEKQVLSTVDTRDEAQNVASRSRGAFSWVSPTAQTVLPVPDSYRPAAACQYTSAVASFAPSSLRGMIKAGAGQLRRRVDYMGFVGADLQEVMSGWTERQYGDTNIAKSGYVVNMNATDKKFVQILNVFEFDQGIVTTAHSYNLACDEATGAASDYSAKSGLFLDMKLWDIRWYKRPTAMAIEDQGGGPRGFHRSYYVLECSMPRGQLSVYTKT